MKVRVKLFASFREIVGQGELRMEVVEGSTIGDVVSKLIEKHPRLSKISETMIYSVNKEYADSNRKLQDGDEIGVLPPISGG